MRVIAASTLLLFAAFAGAQAPRIDKPFSVEVGAFFPNNDETDFGRDVGVSAAFGYSFRRIKAVTLSGQIRGAYHLVTVGGADDVNSLSGSLTVVSGFVNARLRPLGSRAFAGLGLGVGRATVEDGRDRTGVLVAFEAGYDLAPQAYVVARYETSGPDTLCGATLAIGFRF